MRQGNLAEKHGSHAFSQFKLTNWLLNNLSQFDITPTAKLVLLELSACYNPKKADMFPKQKTLANKIGVSERSVVRAIQELFKAGLIIIECKFTNRYKFTSRIVAEQSENEKNFTPENMSDDLGKDVILQDDKLSPHKHEHITEPINEPQKVEDFKILKEYAEARNVKHVKAYIKALIKSGADKKIIKEYHDKKRADRRGEQMCIDTQNLLAEYRKNAALVDLEPRSEKTEALLKEVLKKYRRV